MKIPSTSSFRTDINGLRAWAVIAVLLFHFKIPGFEAGFMGVDIFFVISGFLMTGIIARGLEQGSFSIWQFYMARFRRIVPAVAALIVALLALGWFWLPTTYYQELGKESLSSLAFISNFYYWRTSGYFGATAIEQWLLHTWSLGVEMQFYILFPIFALVIWKIKPSIKVFFYSLIFLALGSLALSIAASSWQPVAAFYLLPTRGWELAAGGMVYFLSQQAQFKNHSKALYFIGLTFWLIGFYFIDSSLPWPSGWALLPVLGTACIILAAQQHTLLMGNPVAQWLGNISYSVYLWHWPLVVGLHFAGLQDNWVLIAVLFALSLILGDLSFRFIESSTRKGLIKFSINKQSLGFALIFFAVATPTVLIIKNKFDGRINEQLEIAAFESKNRNWHIYDKCRYRVFDDSIAGCEFGAIQGELKAALFGNSHSESIASALEKAANKNGDKYIYLGGAHGCPILKDHVHPESGRHHCSKYMDLVVSKLNELDTNVSLLIVTTDVSGLFDDYESYQAAMQHTVCPITETGRKVYLTRPIPSMNEDVPKAFVRNLMLGKESEDIFVLKSEYLKKRSEMYRVQDFVAEACGVKILDTTKYLCDDEKCYGSKDGRPMFFDAGHISEYGNKFLVPMFEEIFKK